MKDILIIGVDLAKQVFQLDGATAEVVLELVDGLMSAPVDKVDTCGGGLHRFADLGFGSNIPSFFWWTTSQGSAGFLSMGEATS